MHWLSKWKSRTSRVSFTHRQLRCEPLEGRSLLAIAAFTVNLFEDAGGVPGSLIADDAVPTGGSFFVEITAREYDPMAAGLRGVSLDIAWDPRVLREIDADFDPADPASPLVTSAFPLFREGTLNNDAGTIDNLSGYAFLSAGAGRAIGNLKPERFALLRFQALETAATSPLSLRQGRTSIVTVPAASLTGDDLHFESPTITVVAKNPAPPAVEPAAESVEPPSPTPAEPTPEPVSVTVDPHFVGPLPADVFFQFVPAATTPVIRAAITDGVPSGPIVADNCRFTPSLHGSVPVVVLENPRPVPPATPESRGAEGEAAPNDDATLADHSVLARQSAVAAIAVDEAWNPWIVDLDYLVEGWTFPL